MVIPELVIASLLTNESITQRGDFGTRIEGDKLFVAVRLYVILQNNGITTAAAFLNAAKNLKWMFSVGLAWSHMEVQRAADTLEAQLLAHGTPAATPPTTEEVVDSGW